MVDLKKYPLKEPIYIGYSNHDCEVWYECPYCGNCFGHWELYLAETWNKYKCPKCRKILKHNNKTYKKM